MFNVSLVMDSKCPAFEFSDSRVPAQCVSTTGL